MEIRLVDAFDLPDWLGTEPVTWAADSTLTEQPLIRGELSDPGGETQQLDLLAVDAAYPRVVCGEDLRHEAHQAWQFGQVVLFDVDGRVACAVPGTRFDADLACETLRRLAKAVGAQSKNFTVSIAL